MNSSIYLQPVEIPEYNIEGIVEQRRIGDVIITYNDFDYFPSLDNIELAIIGIKESRASINNFGCKNSPEEIRKYLYSLYAFRESINLVDLGNIEQGNSIEDTYFAARNVIAELLEKKITVIILGGSQDLTYANYMAYERIGKIINITTIDSAFDIGNAEEQLTSRSFVSKIILHQPNYLFNLTNIGYQSYFVDHEAVSLMKRLLFDTYRLGIVNSNLEESEPLVRNSDILSFDISSIRQSDAPGNANASPNGFYGEQACQITRYAGMSDKVSSIGFYEVNPDFDNNGHTSHLVAQMIWYFMEGFYYRKNDNPRVDKDQYIKYTVALNEEIDEIVFFKSKKSGRWWMEVPLSTEEYSKYERHYMVPCSYNDYQTAMNKEIPDRWWQVYQKLM